MFFEDKSTSKLGVAYVRPAGLQNEAPSLWTAEDICAIYVRLLTRGWLEPELVPIRLMDYYGRRLGHYVRLAREEREARARNVEHRREVDRGFAAIAEAFGGR